MGRPLVLYHGGCMDGQTAAWAAWVKLGDGADYLGVYHGRPLAVDVTGRDVYVLDFSWKRPAMLDIARACNRLVVLDHHESARQDLDGLLAESGTLGQVVFDMGKSGAVLAWEHFHPGVPVPLLCQYVQDRDLWHFKLPFSRSISAYLASLEFSFEMWNRLRNSWCPADTSTGSPRATGALAGAVAAGDAILRYQGQLLERLVKQARPVTIAGHTVPAVNTGTLISEVAGKLAENAPFAACYFDNAEGQRIWSLRSRGEGGLNVKDIAVALGGGGHPQAAGFQEELTVSPCIIPATGG